MNGGSEFEIMRNSYRFHKFPLRRVFERQDWAWDGRDIRFENGMSEPFISLPVHQKGVIGIKLQINDLLTLGNDHGASRMTG